MTVTAINYLSANQEGYFLLIDGGRIEHANHAGNAYRTMVDGVVFDDAVAAVVAMTDPNETLIIVTAGHGHAMAFNGYCGCGSPINGLCMEIDRAGEKY